MKKPLIIFLVVALLIVGGVYVLKNKSYPIASVNDILLPAELFDSSFEAAINYYQKQGVIDLQDSDERLRLEAELSLGTLNLIIEQEILSQELAILIGDELMNRRVLAKIIAIEEEKGEDLHEAVDGVLDLKWEDFKTLVLIPEAKREVLAEELQSRGIDFMSWFEEKQRIAQVEVFLSGYNWENGELVFE